MGERKKWILHDFKDDNGNFDYEMYKRIQIEGNKKKINRTWVIKESIEKIVNELPDAKKILCHGTRRGAEQQFFKELIPKSIVLGTEISDTATQFPNTIQWDFHNIKSEWINNFDIVYSNSFDHSYNPRKCIETWVQCINKNGYVVIEHSTFGHGPKTTSLMDPFGCTLDHFPTFINNCGRGVFFVDKTIVTRTDEHTVAFFIKKSL